MKDGCNRKMTEAFKVIGAERTGPWVISCDHASNHVPTWISGGCLGIPDDDMSRHIAYDIGAAGLAEALSRALNGPAILSRFSRLVIDPNRGEDDPTLLMKLYDGSIIPANRNADAADRERRLDRLYRPYHAALSGMMTRPDAILVSVHSFTPRLNGRRPRPWQVGILSAHDRRLSAPLLDIMGRDEAFAEFVERESGTPLCLGDNEPYPGHLPGDAVDQHALSDGRLNVLLELRQDLIGEPDQQFRWAEHLARLLIAARDAM